MDFVLRSKGKNMGDHGIKWGGKTFLDLANADDLSILNESVSKINELSEVLRVQGAKIGSKINVKKTKSLRLGISENGKVTLGNEKIDQVGSFTYLSSINSKDGESSEDVKNRIAKAQGVFSLLKKVWKNRKTSLQTKIRILEGIVKTVSNMALKHGRSKKRMKIHLIFSREIAYRLFWVPGRLTLFQTVGCVKKTLFNLAF